MARAARTLTPVTLELGGKNPVFIDDAMDDAFLAVVVKEIVRTKQYFAGEFCQSHDYCLVAVGIWDRFITALKAEINALGERRLVRLINERQYERVKAMLTSHHGDNLPPLSSDTAASDGSWMLPVTAVVEPYESDLLMQEEVFGPLLPVRRVASIADAIAYVKASPTGKPLVSYYYGHSTDNSNAYAAGGAAPRVPPSVRRLRTARTLPAPLWQWPKAACVAGAMSCALLYVLL